MAIQVIALPEKSAQWTQLVTLDDQNYLLEMMWSQRESRWYWRLATEANVTIRGFQKLSVDWDLLKTCATGTRPPGILFALDTSKRGLPAGFDDLGVRVLLCYTPAADL